MWKWNISAFTEVNPEPYVEGCLRFMVTAKDIDEALATARGYVGADYAISEITQDEEVENADKS